MNILVQRIRRAASEEDGVLTFEWVLLLTLLVLGIVSGLTAARDAIIDELADLATATVHLDQSYNVEPFEDSCDGGITAPGFSFNDTDGIVIACERATELAGQGTVINCDFNSVTN